MQGSEYIHFEVVGVTEQDLIRSAHESIASYYGREDRVGTLELLRVDGDVLSASYTSERSKVIRWRGSFRFAPSRPF